MLTLPGVVIQVTPCWSLKRSPRQTFIRRTAGLKQAECACLQRVLYGGHSRKSLTSGGAPIQTKSRTIEPDRPIHEAHLAGERGSSLKRKHFSVEQIVGIAKRAELGVRMGWRREYNERYPHSSVTSPWLETAKQGWKRGQHHMCSVVDCDSIISVS